LQQLPINLILLHIKLAHIRLKNQNSYPQFKAIPDKTNQLAQKRKKEKKKIYIYIYISYPACDDDPRDNRNERHIGKPSLPLQGHKVRKDSSEKRRRSPNSLVERDGQEAERDVAEDDRHTENETECRDLEELDSRPNGLHGNHLQPGDGHVAEERASGHVAHGEEDRVLESVVAEQVLVEQEHPNVGGVPGGDEADREKPA
jgi:hypothetical protein